MNVNGFVSIEKLTCGLKDTKQLLTNYGDVLKRMNELACSGVKAPVVGGAPSHHEGRLGRLPRKLGAVRNRRRLSQCKSALFLLELGLGVVGDVGDST